MLTLSRYPIDEIDIDIYPPTAKPNLQGKSQFRVTFFRVCPKKPLNVWPPSN